MLTLSRLLHMIEVLRTPFSQYEAVIKPNESNHNNNNNVHGARCGESLDRILHHVSILRPRRNWLCLPTFEWQTTLSMTESEPAPGDGGAVDLPGPITQPGARKGRTPATPRQPTSISNGFASLWGNPESTKTDTRIILSRDTRGRHQHPPSDQPESRTLAYQVLGERSS